MRRRRALPHRWRRPHRAVAAAERPRRKDPAPPASGKANRPAGDGRRRRDLRKEVDRLERAWERAEAEVAELQRQLADPEVYADADAVGDLVARHDEAKDRASTAMSDWERAALALEAVDAGAGRR